MNKPDKLILTIKQEKVYTVEVCPENGYDAFPDNIMDLVDYVQEIKDNPANYVGDDVVRDGVAVLAHCETTLLGIEET